MNRVMLLAILFLYGCDVIPEQFFAAQKACEAHGGLRAIETGSARALCNDGSIIYDYPK